MFQFKIKAPKLKFPDKILTKQIMVGAGLVVVNNYKQRMFRNKDRTRGVKDGKFILLKANAPATIKKKGSSKPLVDSGRMINSFQVDTTKTTHKKAVMNFPPSEAWKAGIHQKGVKTKKVKIPARPHVGFSSTVIKRVLKYINVRTLDKLGKGIKIENAR